MNIWIVACTVVFSISLLLTGIIIPQVLLIAFRKKLFDTVDKRKIHQGVVPRLGGIAFMPAIFFSIAFVVGCSLMSGLVDISVAIMDDGMLIAFGSCAMILMFLVGIADDLIGVKYRAKFIAQIISAMFLVAAGASITNLEGFLGIYGMPQYCSWMLTILVIVFITNAINLIDGIDGLASGLSAVGLLFYGVVFLITGLYLYAILAFATLGTLTPFFYYNVFGDPTQRKKIFMGDTGALTIGIVLSLLSIVANRYEIGESEHLNPVVVAFSPLILPCFDVVRVYIHRIRSGRNPFLPDKCHIHHKFLALGLPQRITMILILMISVCFVIMNLLLAPYFGVTFLVFFNVFVYMGGNVLLTMSIRRRETKLGNVVKLYE